MVGGDVLGACQVIFRINQRENKWLTIKELRAMYLILSFLVIGVKVLAVGACRYAEEVLMPLRPPMPEWNRGEGDGCEGGNLPITQFYCACVRLQIFQTVVS